MVIFKKSGACKKTFNRYNVQMLKLKSGILTGFL